MQVKQLFALTALALAAGAVLADQAAVPLTRAEVEQSVLAARAAGTLMPAGEGDYPDNMHIDAAPSGRTRAQARAEVLQARAEGTLRHAGEEDPEELMAYDQKHPSTSLLTRAEVKAEVLQARADGELIPAGEGEYPGAEPATQTARVAATPGQTVASRGAN
jgi:hypothetical protein